MPDNVTEALGRLRNRIDGVDRKIVELLEERLRVVEEVVALKKAHQLPVYHPSREEDLISDRRKRAKEKAMDPDFVEEIFRSIMRQSRASQGDRMTRGGIRTDATVLVVGGEGEMGRYFAGLFQRAGYPVRILDTGDWDQVSSLCENVDLAIVSVPIGVTDQVVERLAPHLPEKAILADITSTKCGPLAAMTAAHKGPVLGLHPLFGPTTGSLDKQIIIATPGRDPDRSAWLKEQFAAWGAIVVSAEAEEHDELMAIVQALRHFATFAFGQFLRRRKVDLARTLEFSSPIYRLELGMVGRLFAQDPGLYSEIIFASPDRLEMLKDYIASLSENAAMLEAGDKEGFMAEFRKIAEWFGPFGEQALRESSYLINRLIERF